MSKDSQQSGIGFTSLLLIAFIVLKLCNIIAWSWWWVLSPFWIPAGLALILGVIYLLIKDKHKPKQPEKSRWQQRMEEMQKKQKSEVN